MSLSLVDKFIDEHLSDDVSALVLHRNRYSNLSDADFLFALQQIEGHQLLHDKVPDLPPDWWYPSRIGCEQCSSGLTAAYKARLLQKVLAATSNSLETVLYDLTGGAGIDTYYLSKAVVHTDYVERQPELCALARHNFGELPISVYEMSAEQFLAEKLIPQLQSDSSVTPVVYLDPARRDVHGNKVFRLEDCSPNAVELLNLLGELRSHCVVMLKLSPMLDLTAALTNLPGTFETHVVAVKNEVKELLLLSVPSCIRNIITAIDLVSEQEAFAFTRREEVDSPLPTIVPSADFHHGFLYEPSSAILKAGAYRLVAQRFGLSKLDQNTHLYMADDIKEDFPGRCWRILDTQIPKNLHQANVLTRNYVLTPEQLKKKLHLRDGGTQYVIGARANGKPCLFLAERIK